MSKLENDCLYILQYAAKNWPRWIPITEITEVGNIPPSTVRTIFSVSKKGVFLKYDGEKTSIHPDVFDKIAKKYRFDYKIKKMVSIDGRLCWHISATKMSYSYDSI